MNFSVATLPACTKEVPRRWYIYIVMTARSSLYTGISTDVDKRIETHNQGKGSKALLGQLPIWLVWSDGPTTHTDAALLERRIKKMSRSQKISFLAGWGITLATEKIR